MAEGCWNRVWVFLGAASAFHVLVGGWSMVIAAGMWLMDMCCNGESGGKFFRTLSSQIPGLVTGGLLALAGVVPALALTWNQPADLVAESNRIYVFERLPHHLAILTMPAEDVVRRLARHGLLILCLCALAGVNRRIANQADGALWTTTRFAWGAIFLAAIGLAIELAFWNSPLTAAALLRYYWFRLTDFAVPLAVAFQAVSLVVVGFRDERRWAVAGLAATLAFSGWHLASDSWQRWVNPVPPADARMRDYAAWVDVCEWVAQHTPPDAVFLTPRLANSFKWRTGRAEVATQKDVPQDADSMVQWFERLRTVYYEEVDGQLEPAPSVGHLGNEHVAKMARKYGIDYVITDHRRSLKFPVAYWNQEYVVYSIKR
jgi:hypothetical protein